MADITQVKVGSTTYDIKDNTKLPKTTYEWNKEFAAGSNGAISLGRYNMYDTQLTFDIDSTTTVAMSGKLVIATQNGRICEAKVFGDATNALVPCLQIYQSAISNNRSWIEIFCNFAGWSKNKVHIYGVALNSATVEKQMTSVTITDGVVSSSNITSGDTKWTGTIVNAISLQSSSESISITAGGYVNISAPDGIGIDSGSGGSIDLDSENSIVLNAVSDIDVTAGAINLYGNPGNPYIYASSTIKVEAPALAISNGDDLGVSITNNGTISSTNGNGDLFFDTDGTIKYRPEDGEYSELATKADLPSFSYNSTNKTLTIS